MSEYNYIIDYKCVCGKEFKKVVGVYKDETICWCGAMAKAVNFIEPEKFHRVKNSPVYIMPEYYSPIDNKPILTPRQRREDFKRNNARPYEGREQEQKEANRRKEEIEAKQDKALERAVTETYYQLPPEKRRILEKT